LLLLLLLPDAVPSELRVPSVAERALEERNLEGDGSVITTEVVLRLAAAAAAAEVAVPGAGRLLRSLSFCVDAYDAAHACTQRHRTCNQPINVSDSLTRHPHV
jgi:hypothetical protein